MTVRLRRRPEIVQARVIRDGTPPPTVPPANAGTAAQAGQWVLGLPSYCHALLALAPLQLALFCTSGALLIDAATGDTQSDAARDAARLCGSALILGGCWTLALLASGLATE